MACFEPILSAQDGLRTLGIVRVRTVKTNVE
jgi:hypothetical protein